MPRMPIPDHVSPTNLRPIEFLTLTPSGWESKGQVWVDDAGYVRADTDYANRVLDGGICGPNVLAKPPRMATREDGAVCLYGLCVEA